MGNYTNKTQISQLEAAPKQLEARLPRTANVSLANAWTQQQHSRNHKSEYDRLRHELSNSALPFQTQEGVLQRKA